MPPSFTALFTRKQYPRILNTRSDAILHTYKMCQSQPASASSNLGQKESLPTIQWLFKAGLRRAADDSKLAKRQIKPQDGEICGPLT
uniref:Uncharacterized protein n=1 Tax=Kalanchoe fedtschenkoi TaxID=63787 RepID=A0A7N0V7T8_KALFE